MTVRTNRWTLVGLLCLLAAVALLLPQAGGLRAWSGYSTLNIPICIDPGSQTYPQITSDGSGGAIIAWSDARNGHTDIYAQRVDSTGAAQWAVNGVAVCTASGNQQDPQITTDGSGGAIITWQDYRDGQHDIYAQRVDSDGVTLWDENGVVICDHSGDQQDPQITTDGSGGAIITWRDSYNGYDIYAQRVDSDGEVQWAANGVAICGAAQNQVVPRIVSDGLGGAIITWTDYRDYNADIYAQRVDSDGVTQWTEHGIAICNLPGAQDYPQITSDGSGGAVITWGDYRSGNYDIYAQRVNSSGTALWPDNGTVICNFSSDQSSPQITSDGSGGAIIIWRDYRHSNYDIYAQRVNSTGAVQWHEDGIAICTASGQQNYLQIISDGSGGAIMTWGDLRNYHWDIYAQRINSGGAVQWTADGVGISTATGAQLLPQIIPDGSGGAMITWSDGRNGNWDIYAESVDSSGNIPDYIPPTVTLSSTAISPTKTSPIPVTATFSEPVTGFAIGDIVVVNGTPGNLVAESAAVYTFDVTPTGQGLVTVDVPADAAQDAGSNGNTAATQFSITYDTVAPAVTLSSTASPATNISPIPVTATFSENVTGFALDDIVVGNGTADNFVAVSGSVYTFDVTPGGDGEVTVNIAVDVAFDAAGNGNTAATQFSITYDTVAPAVTLSSTASPATNISPIPVTATFSENVTGFTMDHIMVGNGTPSNFVAVSGSVYTFDVTPGGDGEVTVNIAVDVAFDAAGNGNTAASQFSITYDTVPPTVILSTTAGSTTGTSPIPMTATFNEAVTGFSIADIEVVNGTPSNFVAVSATVYTFDVTPGVDGVVTVNVAVDVAFDAAGNGNAAASQFTITYDSVSPVVTLNSTAIPPTNASPIPVTATFSKAVTGFTVDDIKVGNGTPSNFVVVSGTVYTFDVTPGGQGVVTVDVDADVAFDGALNGNLAATQFSITYDSVPPTVTLGSTASPSTGSSPIPVTATFSEAVTGFTMDHIMVGNGTPSNFVAVSNTVYTFDVTPDGQGVMTVDIAAGVAQDAALNGNLAATRFSITYDTVPPTATLTSTAASSTNILPIPMMATFSEAVTGFTMDHIMVGNGTPSNFVAVSSTVYTFDVTPDGQGVVTVDIAAGVAQDAAGNGNAAAVQFSTTFDTEAPTLTLTSTAGSSTSVVPIPVTVTFSKPVTGFAIDDIEVVNGTASNFVAVSSTVYVFDLTPSSTGLVTVHVDFDVAHDAAGNGNMAAGWNITYGSPPTITSFTKSSSAGGDVVVINGTNFTGATAVKFGDTDVLSFTVDSDTRITASVKSGTSGRISVTTPAGTVISDQEYVSPASPSGSGKVWLIGGIIGGLLLLGAVGGWLEMIRRRKQQPSV